MDSLPQMKPTGWETYEWITVDEYDEEFKDSLNNGDFDRKWLISIASTNLDSKMVYDVRQDYRNRNRPETAE